MQQQAIVRRVAAAFGFAALALLVAAGAFAADDRPTEIPIPPGPVPRSRPNTSSPATVVLIMTTINPRLVTLDEGELVAWISYSPVPSVVVFEREVARNMICHSLVNFSIQDDELRSAPINAGEFASFCQLKPGRYKYRVVRPIAAERHGCRARLEGEIIIGNPKADARGSAHERQESSRLVTRR
jgi:hypothetical protein